MAASILIIDDEVLTLNNLKRALTKEGYEVLVADSGETGIEIFRKNRPNIVLADLMLPGIDGIEVLKQIKGMDATTSVIMITAYEIIEKAIEAMKLGAYDYLMKPFKITELKASIARALELQSLRVRVSDTVESEKGKYYFDRIIAQSNGMIEVLRTARRVAPLDKTTILLTGESGVGKGLLARAIHYNSGRAEEQFIELNCAAVPDSLMESELFVVTNLGLSPMPGDVRSDCSKKRTAVLSSLMKSLICRFPSRQKSSRSWRNSLSRVLAAHLR